MDTKHAREYLAQYFADIATWHDGLPRPDATTATVGHRPRADFYATLSAHISGLDEDDLRVIALAKLTGFDTPAGFSPGPRVSAAIGEVERFSDVGPEPFLDHLVHAALDDQLDHGQHTASLLLPELDLEGQRIG
ncbi:MAG TPA: hypothetical protein VKZ96_01570 [Thermomicrobiales bacterium]|nr:hypothetical protein [Thermomicrobiales bacterium]